MARFTASEAEVLRDVAAQLIVLLGSADGAASSDSSDPWESALRLDGPVAAPRDPALARLLPDAYRGDPESASEFRRLTSPTLVDRKLRSARMLRDSVAAGDVVVPPTDVTDWLTALTDLRLVIAARLGIEHDDEPGTGDPFLTELYGWLGYVQGTLLEAMED